MGLKIQASTGFTEELPILETFKVIVKHLTRGEIEKLDEMTAGKNEDEKSLIASNAYIASWEGLTPGIVRKLGCAIDEHQPVDKDGLIPHDRETARDLWRHAYSNLFMLKVMLCSRAVLEKRELEKEMAKNGYGGWSQPSITL